jgi:hypothetical protein
MSKPTNKINRTIQSEQVLQAFVEVVRRNLPLELKNTRITSEDIIYALAYANVHRLSIEAACQELQGAPSGNRLRDSADRGSARSCRLAAHVEPHVSPAIASQSVERQARFQSGN